MSWTLTFTLSPDGDASLAPPCGVRPLNEDGSTEVETYFASVIIHTPGAARETVVTDLAFQTPLVDLTSASPVPVRISPESGIFDVSEVPIVTDPQVNPVVALERAVLHPSTGELVVSVLLGTPSPYAHMDETATSRLD